MDYYADPRLSNSGLTAFWRKINNLPPFFASEATLEFGRLFHEAIYEADQFHVSKIAHFLPSDRARFARMVIAARNTGLLKFFLNHPGAVVEKSIFFDLYGVPFKMKADLIIPERKSGHDAKTTACSCYDEFLSKFDEYGYWRQAEIYKKGGNLSRFFFTGISKVGQHQTFTIDVSKHAAEMRKARVQVKELVNLWKENKLKNII